MRGTPVEDFIESLSHPDVAAGPWLLVHMPSRADGLETESSTSSVAATLAQGLRRATLKAWIEHDDSCLSTSAEHLRARLLGLPCQDGAIPWAALRAQALGLDTTQTWGFVHPCHWLPGAERTLVEPPELLQLDANAAQALLNAMQPYFAEDGLHLIADQPGRWLVRGEVLHGLKTASLARVIGQDLSRWPPQGPAARLLRRLQSEMQMLLYQHPLHDERKSQGELPVNSFWLDGVGRLPPGFVPRAISIQALRWPATPFSTPSSTPLPGPCSVALCGERGLAVLTLPGDRSPSLWRPLAHRLSAGRRARELHTVLQQL